MIITLYTYAVGITTLICSDTLKKTIYRYIHPFRKDYFSPSASVSRVALLPLRHFAYLLMLSAHRFTCHLHGRRPLPGRIGGPLLWQQYQAVVRKSSLHHISNNYNYADMFVSHMYKSTTKYFLSTVYEGCFFVTRWHLLHRRLTDNNSLINFCLEGFRNLFIAKGARFYLSHATFILLRVTSLLEVTVDPWYSNCKVFFWC